MFGHRKPKRKMKDLTVRELAEYATIGYSMGSQFITARLIYQGLSTDFDDYELLQALADWFVESKMVQIRPLSACVFEYLHRRKPELNQRQSESLDMKYASAMWIWGLSKRKDESEYTQMGDFLKNRGIFIFDMKTYNEWIASVTTDSGSLQAAVHGARNFLGMVSNLIELIVPRESFQPSELFFDERWQNTDEFCKWLESDLSVLAEIIRVKERQKLQVSEQDQNMINADIGQIRVFDLWTKKGGTHSQM